MDYDKNEARRRRELEKVQATKTALEAKLAEVARQARSAKARLLATTKSESWHRHALAWHDRDAGYTGEMASARVYLRSLPIQDYIAALAPYAEANPNMTTVSIEVAAVTANLDAWNVKGDELLLERARCEYVAEVASFRQWEKDNPDKKGWRQRPPTRSQWFQISRDAERLGIDMPVGLNRGEAHDWIEAHGGNLRLVADRPTDADGTNDPEALSGDTMAKTDIGMPQVATDASIAMTPDEPSKMALPRESDGARGQVDAPVQLRSSEGSLL